MEGRIRTVIPIPPLGRHCGQEDKRDQVIFISRLNKASVPRTNIE